MSICLFIGPTLRRGDIPAELDAFALPPAQQGDVYRAALNRPEAIGIVDGYFGGAPSVWHKEILWALSEGIQVFGSASMGALRAAELSSFGMRGVGRITLYSSDQLEPELDVGPVAGARSLFARLRDAVSAARKDAKVVPLA